MNRTERLQLGLWREASRHIDIAHSHPALLAAIRHAIPSVQSMQIFMIHSDRVWLEAPAPASPADRPAYAGEHASRLIRFARMGGIALFNPARPGRSLVRSLADAIGPSRAVVGGLQRDGHPEGVVAWRFPMDAALNDALTEMLAITLDPLAVAVDTSRRFHELEDLRRSAEADRQSALRRLGRESLSETIVGAEGGLKPTMQRVAMVAPQDVPVLLLGETGSGKEVIARAIHERSSRHEGPFIRVNCGAIPPELIDSQLFGHERGAFTGATDRRLGWFERANGGTLFLDEIGELSLAAQVRLLRVVQEGILERVGGQEPLSIDCRIIAATHRDLAEMVRQRAFREDLWYRLAVFPLMIPPLRERTQDLPDLVRHFAHRASMRFGLPEFEIHDDDMNALAAYDWPGNIRELAAVIDRAALLGKGHRLAIASAIGAGPARAAASPLPNAPGDHHAPLTTLEDAIKLAIESALRQCRGRVEGPHGAAALLKVNPNTLRSKIRKHKIDTAAFRSVSSES